MDWQVAEAKNRFSELFTQVMTQGVQRVRRRNETMVLIPEKEYERLTGERQNFIEHLLSIPDMSDVELVRDQGPARDPSREVKW